MLSRDYNPHLPYKKGPKLIDVFIFLIQIKL